MGGSSDGFGSAQTGTHSTKVFSQERFAPVEALSGHSESQGRTVFRWTGPGGQHLPTTDALVRAKAQPRRKGGDSRKRGKVGTDFGQEHLCRQGVDPRHLSEINSESAIEILPEADRFVSPSGLSWVAGFWNRVLSGINLGRQLGQQLFDLLVHFCDQVLVMPVSHQGLAKGKEVLVTVVPYQRFHDGFPRGSDTPVSELSQPLGITFTRQDGVHNGQTRGPGEVADNVMDLKIHLVERFLHVLKMNRGHLDQAVAMAPERAEGTDLLIGTERTS